MSKLSTFVVIINIKLVNIIVKNNLDFKNIAITAINQEAAALQALSKQIDTNFEKVVESILKSKGRVVISGIGKSAIIAQKIVATLNSTGTPSLFMHAADAIHGDLGMIQEDDLVIVISKSGNTPEIKVLASLLRQNENILVAIVGNTDSFLAQQADYILDTTVEREACPFNLAPTTSTTAQLAMGDALAVCLIEGRKFTDRDFAKFHPGGALGKRLYVKTGDLYMKNSKPFVSPEASIKNIILEISKHRLGTVAVIENQKILGIITDGDIRRMLVKDENTQILKARDIMGHNPKSIEREELAIHALELMKNNNISQLLVTNQGEYDGVIHIQDLLKEGIL